MKTVIPVILGAAGMSIASHLSGSPAKQNIHADRIRVNFNLNRSFFNHGSQFFSEKYFQYSVYGVPTTKSENALTDKKTSGRTNFAEVVALKNVSFWCDVSAMKEFHKALDKSMKETLKEFGVEHPGQLESSQRGPFFTRREEILIGIKNKHPFTFVEGEQVPYENGMFTQELATNNMDLNAPDGLASFNPRNPNFQPPGFTFSPIARKESDIIPVNEQKFLIGAKFALMGNSVATPFPPVYVWEPCVCDQSQVWYPRRNGRPINKNFPGFVHGRSNWYTNTLDLYSKIMSGNAPEGFDYDCFHDGKVLHQHEQMREVVTQKTDRGNQTGYTGPMRQFIQADRHIVSQDYKGRFK